MGKHKNKEKHQAHHKKKHKEKKHKKKYRSSSSSSEEWVEKEVARDENIHSKTSSFDEPEPSSKSVSTGESGNSSQKRDEWMDLSTSFSSVSNLDRRKERDRQKQIERQQQMYNPSTCTRELNPYWKDGGDGLPKFKRPRNEEDSVLEEKSQSVYPSTAKGWRKKRDNCTESKRKENTNDSKKLEYKDEQSESIVTSELQSEVISDKELNMLASKLVKAEIMGNSELVRQLKEKLDMARKMKECQPNKQHDDEIILTHTDSKGHSRPIRGTIDENFPSSSKSKKQKVETHKDGQRVRYFADDDKYSLKQMFENEKYVSMEDQNRDFIKMAGHIRKNDDLDEIFEDKIRHETDTESYSTNKAVSEHQKLSTSLDNCNKCIQSDNMMKHLMICMGETIYLSVPHYEPLADGHCLLTPIRHVSCATQLDENEWRELMDFRKALTKMFMSYEKTVIFFETAMNFNRFPHMSIECIPIPREEGDLAPIYFKKAIDESEYEWSQNKKLVSLKDRNVQKAIPKGLPYFSVSFGMEEGFAHVIEEEKYFPHNFAQEILGGMLDLHHSKWRKPKRQRFEDQSKRVLEFTKLWSKFDITNVNK